MYTSPYIKVIISRMRWEGHVARMGDLRNAYRILVVELERRRPHGRYTLI
jgi:hypothetical protein